MVIKNKTLSLITIFTMALTACSGAPKKAINNVSQPVANAPVVALVLGGGGAKGFAHIGVIKTLEDNGIKPDLIVGTSVGSLMGSLYASGMPIKNLETLAINTPDSELTDFTLSHQGIIEGKKLRKFINYHVRQQPIESFPIRFGAIATQKNSLKKTVFTKGEPGLAVQASCSVPNIFIAPRIPEKVGIKYIDGGVVSMVPVDTAKQLGADVVIAVDLQVKMPAKSSASFNQNSVNLNTKKSFWSLIETGYNQVRATNGYNKNNIYLNQSEIERADVVIQPIVADIHTADTSRRKEAIKAGSIATEQKLTKIKLKINQANSK